MGCSHSSTSHHVHQHNKSMTEGEHILALQRAIPPPTSTYEKVSELFTTEQSSRHEDSSSLQQQQQQRQHESPLIEVTLKKRRPGCTGMFWRRDPTGAELLVSNDNWPRDGAKLRGYAVVVKGKKWLLARHVLQAGSSQWLPAPHGAAIPFEYDNHYYLE